MRRSARLLSVSHLSRNRTLKRSFFEALEARVLLAATDLGDIGQFASPLTAFNGALYFTAGDGVHGDELWKTDGTPGGTTLVKEINPNPITSATISTITVVGDKLLFAANNGTDGPQLWVSDGTAAGTVPLAGTQAPTLGFKSGLSVVAGEAYYVLEGGGGTFSIWKTNGTAGGTSAIKALPTDATAYSNPFQIGSRMYLLGSTLGSGALPYYALYSFNISDNTLATVVPFSEQRTISALTNVAGTAYFYTGSTTHPGLDLERHDAVNGRVHIADTVNNPAASTNVPAIATVGGKVFFTADSASNVSGLWVTSATTSPQPVVSAGLAVRPINLTVAGGRLYYFAQYPTTFALFSASPDEQVSAPEATPLAQVAPSSDLYRTSTDFNGRLLFIGIGNDGNPDLWISDGTVAGTRALESLDGISPANPSKTFIYDIRELAVLNNDAIIRSRPDSLRHHLYAADLAAVLNNLPAGALDVRDGQVIVTGHAMDPDTPSSDITIRVDIDGNVNTTFTATTAAGSNGRSFTWYVPPLNFDSHTVEFYAVDTWTDEAVKIGTRTFVGDGLLFDERWYLNANPDVLAVVNGGGLASGLAHFVAAGNAEGRAPNAFFMPDYYLSKNPDVAAAINAGNLKSAWEHFRLAGMAEKRDPSPFFDTAFYLLRNPDVAAAVNAGIITPFQHFFFTGQFEKRTTTSYFSQVSYLLMNPDVRAVVGPGNISSAMQHFITVGQSEDRTYVAQSAFDESAYLARYPDVAAAVASGTFRSGLEHFLWTGEEEGRLAT